MLILVTERICHQDELAPDPDQSESGPQSIDELREVLPALNVRLTAEEMRWLNLEEWTAG